MSDIRAAEAAFTVLDQVGVDMGAFIKSFVAGSADGTGFTILANEMISSQTPGQSLRKNIYENAYLKSLEISNKPLKGLVRFISSVALLSEILAETAGSDARFDQDDVASAGNDCRDIGSNGAACLTAPECGDGIPDTGATVDIDTTEPTGAVTLQMINAVIEKVFTAMGDDELGAGGSFGSTKSMADAVTNAGGQIGVGSGCYRAELLVQKFGYLKEE